MNFDKRITPARPDLAAAHLKGEVTAARFAEGTRRALRRGRCSLRAAPESYAAQETELLFGETFTFYEEKDGWAWGQAALDGYVGYVHTLVLGEDSAPTHLVRALSAPVLVRPDVKAAAQDFLPMNARLRLEKEVDGFAQTNAGFVSLRHLAPLGSKAEDFVAVAQHFLGTPYVWGGKTFAGMDCSGLIQTALQAAGISSPRDTDMMEKSLGSAAAGPHARGDLIFWKGHAGVMLDGAALLHANAFHMEVAIEPLDEAVRRIAPLAGSITSIKRL